MSEISVSEQFHLEQIKALRGEIDENMKQLRQIELYAVLGSVAVWAFLLTHQANGQRITTIGWLMPVFLIACSAYKHYTTNRAIRGLGSYIRRCEGVFSFQGLGWEGSSEREEATIEFLKFNKLFWGVLLLLSLIAAGYHGL
jgi:hypothetical protein